MIRLGQLCLFASITITVECCSNNSSILCDVSRYIVERPDSALVVLENIDRSSIETKRDKAIFSLLYTMALDKTYSDTSDIGLILPAVEFFDRHGSKQDKMKSYLYLGRLQYNAKDYQSAIISYRKALGYAEEIDDLYWRAMITSAIGYTYNQGFCNTEELEYQQKAFALWSEYGDSTILKRSYWNLATAYHNNYDVDTADSLYRLAISLPPTEFDLLLDMADNEIKRDVPNADSVVNWISNAIKNKAHATPEHYYEYAFALLMTGDEHSCNYILTHLSALPDDAKSLYWKGKIAMRQGDYAYATDLFTRYRNALSKTIKTIMSQSVFKAERNYYELQTEVERKNRTIVILISLSFALLCTAIVCLIFLHSKEQKRKLEYQISYLGAAVDEVSRMLKESNEEKTEAKHQLMDKGERLSDLRYSFISLYRRQFQEIASSFDFGGDPGKRIQKEIEERYQMVINEIQNSADGKLVFERRINADLDNIMGKLRTDYPNFKESDFRLLSFIIVGFDATTRAILMNETNNTSRVRKFRITKYIKEHPTQNSELYSMFII